MTERAGARADAPAVNARAREARARLLAAAARAFADRGFHGVSMRDLARETGRSLGAFYNHFESKEELLFTLQRDSFDELLASAGRAIACVSAAPARLHLFVLNHLRYIASHPAVMRVLVHEAGALEGAWRAEIRNRKQAYFDLAHGVIAGVVGSRDRLEIERVTYCVFGMLNWTYGWYAPERHGPPEVLARTIHRVVLGGAAGDDASDDFYRAMARHLDSVDTPPLIPTAEEMP